MTEVIIAVAALAVGFGIGFLVRGASQPKQVRRKKPKHGERRAAPAAGNGSSDRVRRARPVETRWKSCSRASRRRSPDLPSESRLRRCATAGSRRASRSRAPAAPRSTASTPRCTRSRRSSTRLGELMVGRRRPRARHGSTPALNELFAAARRLAPYGQGDEADARDREALESRRAPLRHGTRGLSGRGRASCGRAPGASCGSRRRLGRAALSRPPRAPPARRVSARMRMSRNDMPSPSSAGMPIAIAVVISTAWRTIP